MTKDEMSNVSSEYEKYPLKKLEFALTKLISGTQCHLDLFRQHKSNIEKYGIREQWNKVKTEQINASRTVEQLKSDILQMEVMAQQVYLERDLPLFRERVDPIRSQILTELKAFPVTDFQRLLDVRAPTRNTTDLSPASSLLFWVADNDLQVQCEQESASEVEALLESWERLEQEMTDLNSALHGFAEIVTNQRETVERIDQNIAAADQDTRRGKDSLRKAAVLKTVMLPMMGAVIGTLGGVLLGPVGALVGLKAAGICAVGGGILGFVGGRQYNKHKERAIQNAEVEMHALDTIHRS